MLGPGQVVSQAATEQTTLVVPKAGVLPTLLQGPTAEPQTIYAYKDRTSVEKSTNAWSWSPRARIRLKTHVIGQRVKKNLFINIQFLYADFPIDLNCQSQKSKNCTNFTDI